MNDSGRSILMRDDWSDMLTMSQDSSSDSLLEGKIMACDSPGEKKLCVS